MSVGFFCRIAGFVEVWAQYFREITPVLYESTELLQLLAYYVAVDKGLNVDMPEI